MEKILLTKTQAASVLTQIYSGKSREVNPFVEIEKNNKFLSKSCEELEKKLSKFMQGLVGVVEDPIFLPNES